MSKLHDEMWERYHGTDGHGYRIMTEEAFAAAIDETMWRQREACAEAAKLYTYGYGDREAEKMLAAILNAKVEGA